MTFWNTNIFIKIIEGKQYDVAHETETRLFLTSLSSEKCNILTFKGSYGIVIFFTYLFSFYLYNIRWVPLYFLISLTSAENKNPFISPWNHPLNIFSHSAEIYKQLIFQAWLLNEKL